MRFFFVLSLSLFFFTIPLSAQKVTGSRGDFSVVDTSGKLIVAHLDADTVYLCYNNEFAFPVKSKKVGLINLVSRHEITKPLYDCIYAKFIQDNLNDTPFLLDADVSLFLSGDSSLVLKEISGASGRVLEFFPRNDSAYEMRQCRFRVGVDIIPEKNLLIKNDAWIFSLEGYSPVDSNSVLCALDNPAKVYAHAFSFSYIRPLIYAEHIQLNYFVPDFPEEGYNVSLYTMVSRNPDFVIADDMQQIYDSRLYLDDLAAGNKFTWTFPGDTIERNNSGVDVGFQSGSSVGMFVSTVEYPYVQELYRKNWIFWGPYATAGYSFSEQQWNFIFPDYYEDDYGSHVGAGAELSGFATVNNPETGDEFIMLYENGARLEFDRSRGTYNPYFSQGRNSGTIFSGYRNGSRLAVNACSPFELRMNEMEDPDDPGVFVVVMEHGYNYAASGIFNGQTNRWEIPPVNVSTAFSGGNEVFSSRYFETLDTTLGEEVPYKGVVWRYRNSVRDTASGKIRPATDRDPVAGNFPVADQQQRPSPEAAQWRNGLWMTPKKTVYVNADTIWPLEYEGEIKEYLYDGRIVVYDSSYVAKYSNLYRGKKVVDIGKYYPDFILSSRFVEVQDSTEQYMGTDMLYDLFTGKVLFTQFEEVHDFGNDSSLILKRDYNDEVSPPEYYVIHGTQISGPYDRFDSTVYCIRAYKGNEPATFDFNGKKLFGKDTTVVTDYPRIAGLVLVKSAAGYNLYSTVTDHYLLAEWQDSIVVDMTPFVVNDPVIICWKNGMAGLLDYFGTMKNHSTTWEIAPAKKQKIFYSREKLALTIIRKKKTETRSFEGPLLHVN